MNTYAKHMQIFLDRINRGENYSKMIDEEANKEMAAMLRERLIQLEGVQ